MLLIKPSGKQQMNGVKIRELNLKSSQKRELGINHHGR